MSVDASTVASFTIWNPEQAEATANVARLPVLIAAASRMVEMFIGRDIELVERTEDYTVRARSRVILLRQYPITEVASVEFDVDAEFTGTGGDDFKVNVDSSTGILSILEDLQDGGPNALRVTYTGGLALTAEAMVTDYPDIAHAVNLQVGYMLERRINPGARRDVSAAGGASFASAYSLLDAAKELLLPHRRMRIA